MRRRSTQRDSLDGLGSLVACFGVVVVSQILLVKYGHPTAVWLWCTMLELCQ